MSLQENNRPCKKSDPGAKILKRLAKPLKASADDSLRKVEARHDERSSEKSSVKRVGIILLIALMLRQRYCALVCDHLTIRKDKGMSDLPYIGVIAEIAAERLRQMNVEGWTEAHDDAHTDGSLASAAACYADKLMVKKMSWCNGLGSVVPSSWPESWSPKWWKPKSRRRDLIRAAALIVAEIERLDRAERKT